MKYTCATCGKEFTDNSLREEVFYCAGHWWHKKCCRWMKDKHGRELLIDFPSGGKLLRSTLMTLEQEAK